MSGSALDSVAHLRSGRASFEVKPAAPVRLDHVDGVLAGAASVDITPPPGMPNAGYSSNAHDGEGFRSRLRARVVHLRAGRSSLAIVHCDLLGGSSVLQYLVADAISAQCDVPLAGLMIGATHTHAGAGQFNGTDFYNRFASNRSGFDPAWSAFLVERIASAVIEATQTRRPAKVGFGSIDVWGATRNRSLDPHVTNATVRDKRQEPQRKFAAINPQLRLLRVDDAADSTPIGASVIFSVHGTGISQHSREYNADVWAYLVDELAHHIESSRGAGGVVGAIEGTHADVAPALYPNSAGYRDTKRVGRAIGHKAAELYDSLGDRLSDSVELGCAFEEVSLVGGARRRANGTVAQLPNRPAVGAALAAGAMENLTPVIHRLPLFRAGMPRRFLKNGPQGAKHVIGGRLQPLVLPLKAFPRSIPVQVLRIDSTAVVGLPFEVTVESGRRITAAVLDAVAGPDEGLIDDVVVSSVANEYCGYVATAEEYSRQFYEGGHTLYGPNTERFLAACAADLASALAAGGDVAVQRTPPTRSWNLRVHRYLIESTTVQRSPQVVVEPQFHDYTDRIDGAWEVIWSDAEPGALCWHSTIVRVEVSRDGGDTWASARHDGRRVDDGGTEMEVRHLGLFYGAHRYAARWYDPAFGDDRLHRFVIVDADGSVLLSTEGFN